MIETLGQLREQIATEFKDVFANSYLARRRVRLNGKESYVTKLNTEEVINFLDNKGTYFYLVVPDVIDYVSQPRTSSRISESYPNYEIRLVLFLPKYDPFDVEWHFLRFFTEKTTNLTVKRAYLNQYEVFTQETGSPPVSSLLDKMALVAFDLDYTDTERSFAGCKNVSLCPRC